MTNKEALNQLKIHYNNPNYYVEMDALLLAIEALEKQIPMKIRYTSATKRCGRCNRQLSAKGNIHPKRLYCTGCGQAIDWGED